MFFHHFTHTTLAIPSAGISLLCGKYLLGNHPSQKETSNNKQAENNYKLQIHSQM